MRLFFLPLLAALGLSACAPRALFFHESTKVAFAADYNTSDTQPVATSFGYKRRIVAVVPSQERHIPDGGSERNGTNSGEALSLVSKFNVRAGTGEGIHITNNFASGMAARNMTRSVGSSDALNVLMHSAPIEVSASTGETSSGSSTAEAVNDRLARIMSKRTTAVPASRRTVDLGADGSTTIRKQPQEEAPPSRESVDLDENGNIKRSGKPRDTDIKKEEIKSDAGTRKPNTPASTRSVDLTPDGQTEIKQR